METSQLDPKLSLQPFDPEVFQRVWNRVMPDQDRSPIAMDAPAQPAAPSSEKKAEAPAARQQLYDFVFQVAAFRKQDDADRLCQRLEEKGVRCRVQPSGKVMLVMAMLRGTALDGANLRADFQRMGLGAPIQKSRKELQGRVRQ